MDLRDSREDIPIASSSGSSGRTLSERCSKSGPHTLRTALQLLLYHIVIVIVTTGKLLFHIVKSIKSKIIYLNSEIEGLQY